MFANTPLSVGFATKALEGNAHCIARKLNLLVDNTSYPRLQVMEDKIVLLTKGCSPIFSDFNSHAWQRRSNARKQGLIRACKPGKGVRIIDATAGWGRDAALLAYCGAQVLMLERNKIMAALLNDALSRATLPSTQLLTMLCIDAIQYLQNILIEDIPDVIYIDPMHPVRKKTALVKKNLQVLQDLIGPDQDAERLIALARKRTRLRVVVKWPQQLAPLLPPQASIPGKTVRFDIYSPLP